jgi:hypothetical protein
MTEQTIAQALSGEEIVNAILDKVKTALIRNCDLNPALAYDTFDATIQLQIRMKDSGRVVNVDGKVAVASEEPVDDNAFLHEAEIHIGEAPPNQVRRDTNQPIPTLVTDGDGKHSVKPVRYAKNAEMPEL